MFLDFLMKLTLKRLYEKLKKSVSKSCQFWITLTSRFVLLLFAATDLIAASSLLISAEQQLPEREPQELEPIKVH